MNNQNNKPLLLIAGLFGELTLLELSALHIFPTVITYSQNSVRKKLTGNILRYADSFEIITLQTPDISSFLTSIDLKKFTHIVTIDWEKTFFHNFISPIPIYHLHPSLLPKYRGYTAISEQIKTGVVISGLTAYIENGNTDAGDIIFQKEVEIDYQDIPATFIEKLAKHAAEFIKNIMDNKSFTPREQDETRSSMSGRVRTKDMLIDFNLSAIALHNFIRAYSYPFALAYIYFEDKVLRVPSAYVEKWSGKYGAPGEVINIDDNGLEIATGDGSIIFTEILDENFVKFDYTTISKARVIK